MKYSAQLKAILKAAGWSQEQLARQLRVSFATLNSWVNERSRPRVKAMRGIEQLYVEVIGTDSVNAGELQRLKLEAAGLHTTPQAITSDKAMLDRLTLYLTYHTNTIEGSTMTLADVGEVIFEQKVLANRTAVEQAEARNHQAALHWLLDELAGKGKHFVIDEALIRGLHVRLMNGILSDAGQYRRQAVRIMGARVTLASAAKLPNNMVELAATFQRPPGDSIETMANTHARFEQIHPFSYGNGRTGRLILLAQALQAGLVPPLDICRAPACRA